MCSLASGTDNRGDGFVDVVWVSVWCLHCANGGYAGGRLSSSCCVRRYAARFRFLAIVLLLYLASLHKRIHALGEERSGVP